MKVCKKIFVALCTISMCFSNMEILAQEAFFFHIDEFMNDTISLDINESMTFTPNINQEGIVTFSSRTGALEVYANEMNIMDTAVDANQMFVLKRVSNAPDLLDVSIYVESEEQTYTYTYSLAEIEEEDDKEVIEIPDEKPSNYTFIWNADATILENETKMVEVSFVEKIDQLVNDMNATVQWTVSGCDYSVDEFNANRIYITGSDSPIDITATVNYGQETYTSNKHISLETEYYTLAFENMDDSFFMPTNGTIHTRPILYHHSNIDGNIVVEDVSSQIERVNYSYDSNINVTESNGYIDIVKVNNNGCTLTANVTYKNSMNNSVSMDYSVEIYSLSSISFDQEKISINNDTNVTLYDQNGTLIQSDEVIFISSHPEVAYVENGKYVVNHFGMTTITAMVNGSSDSIEVLVYPSNLKQNNIYIAYYDQKDTYLGDSIVSVNGLNDSKLRSQMENEVKLYNRFYSVVDYSYQKFESSYVVKAVLEGNECDLFPNDTGNEIGTLCIEYYDSETNELLKEANLSNVLINHYDEVNLCIEKNAPFYLSIHTPTIRYGINENNSRLVQVRLQEEHDINEIMGHVSLQYVLVGNPNYCVQSMEFDNVPLNKCMTYANKMVPDGYSISYVDTSEIVNNERTIVFHISSSQKEANVTISQAALQSYFNVKSEISLQTTLQEQYIDEKINAYDLSKDHKEIKYLFGIIVDAYMYNYYYHLGTISSLNQNVTVTIPVSSEYTNGKPFEIAIIQNGNVRYVTPTSLGNGLYSFTTSEFTTSDFNEPYFAIVQQASDKVDVEYVDNGNVIKKESVNGSSISESYFKQNVPSGYTYVSSKYLNKWIVTIQRKNLCGSDCTYSVSNNVLTISGIGRMDDYTSAPWNVSSITRVEIQEGITYIGANAFKNAYNLTSVSLPSSLKEIGNDAFRNCSKLQLTIPSKVTKIDISSIAGIQSITVDSLNTKYRSYNNGLIDSVTNTYLYALKNASIPEGVQRIQSHAFDEYNLSTIEIPSSVTDIDAYAFTSTSLQTVSFKGNPVIQENAFGSNVSFNIGCNGEYVKNYAIENSIRYEMKSHRQSSPTVEILKESTCTESGMQAKQIICLDCGMVIEQVEQEIPALGHEVVKDLKKEATCSEAGLSEGSHCSRCHAMIQKQEVIQPLGHAYSSWKIIKEATCLEDGLQTRTCTRCQHTEENVIPALGHDVKEKQSQDATCTTPGYSSGSYCERCHKNLSDQHEIQPLGHDFGEWTVIKYPTCVEDGQKQRECSRCHTIETLPIYALGHEEVMDAQVNATCTESGLTQGSHCARCNQVIIAQNVISKLGHKTVVDKAIAATCTEPGLTQGSHCARCHEIIKEQKEISPLGHIYGDYTVVKEATCTDKGLKERSCLRCNDVEQAEIDCIDHILKHIDKVEPTCTEYGMEACDECTMCHSFFMNGKKIDSVVQIDPLNHTYDVSKVIKEATCTQSGTLEIDCTRCHQHIEQEIVPMGHDMVVMHGKEATCVETGLTDGMYCQRCNQVIQAQEVIPSLGHELTSWTVVHKATCTQEGVKERHCTRCAYKEQENIPALGHDVVIDEKVEPTCTETGLTEGSHCSRCEEVFVEQVEIDALKHEYCETVVEPTKESEGYTLYECIRCDDSYKDNYTDKLPSITGWIKEDNSWYFYNEEGNKSTGWITNSGYWYYLDENGAMQTYWKQLNGIWYYLGGNGRMCTYWQQINGAWYYFGGNGRMVVGWQQINGTWYYFNGNGTLAKGWLKIGDTWYYFDNHGATCYNWQLINNTWYYFGSNGKMVTGWQLISGSWYYFASNGAMCKDWQLINGSWYYFNSSGVMVTGTVKINGTKYKFNSSGVWIG